MKQLQNFGDNGGGAIMSVPCGFGKTCCALKMAFDLGVRTAIVCHTTDLMLQWAERIDDFFKGARIGIVQQSKCEIEDKDFVICSLKTLALKDFPKNTFRSIGLAVWDEVHLMATNLFSNGFPKLTTRFSIGLSATPFRKDKCEIIFQHFIGPISVYLKRPKNERTEVNCLHYTNDKVVIKYNKWGKINYTSTTVLLCANEKRNEMIKGILIDLANDGRTILVLSEYIKHLKTLHSKLTQFLNEHPEFNFTVGLYIGAMNNDERKVSQECDIILGTYKLASVGMDIPALNTLVLASPRKEIEQSVGRILRKEQGFHPLIIDVIDDCSLFKSQSRIRKNFYREYGYTIMLIKLDVNGKEISRRKGAKNTKRKAKRGEVDVDKLDLDKLNRADPSLLDFSNFVIRK